MKKSTITETEINANQIVGLNHALGFLLGIELKDLGVEITWTVVRAANQITVFFKEIEEMSKKVNKEFYEQDEETKKFSYKKGLEEQAKQAENTIENTKFSINISQIDFSKIEKVKGLTALHVLQLEPILKVA
jgi:flavoprotein